MIMKVQSNSMEGARYNTIRPSQLIGVPGITGKMLPTIPTSIKIKPTINKIISISTH